MARLTRSVVLALIFLGGACSESAVGPAEPEEESVPEAKVQIMEERLSLYALGEQGTLSAILTDGAREPLTWTSSDLDVASVSSSGEVTAVSTGTAWIIVETADRQRDSTAVAVDGSSWIAVTAGEDFACGLAPDGRAFCWGDNSSGQIGIGTDQREVPEPAPVSGGFKFSMVDAGEDHVCGVTDLGRVLCWGQNRRGELGVGDDREESRAPAPIASEHQFTMVSAGFLSSCALDAEGHAYCWGDNRAGQVGDGTELERHSPVAVATALRFIDIDVGAFHGCAVDRQGAAHCWGGNLIGRLGTGGVASSLVPVAVEGDRRWADIAAGLDHTCASDPSGEVYCWGLNDGRQLGSATGFCNPDYAVPCALAPVRVPLEGNGSSLSIGGFSPGFTCALSAGVICWGADLDGPTSIGPSSTSVEAVAAGLEESYALGEGGLLYRWSGSDLGTVEEVLLERVGDRRAMP